eukprot:UN01785
MEIKCLFVVLVEIIFFVCVFYACLTITCGEPGAHSTEPVVFKSVKVRVNISLICAGVKDGCVSFNGPRICCAISSKLHVRLLILELNKELT